MSRIYPTPSGNNRVRQTMFPKTRQIIKNFQERRKAIRDLKTVLDFYARNYSSFNTNRLKNVFTKIRTLGNIHRRMLKVLSQERGNRRFSVERIFSLIDSYSRNQNINRPNRSPLPNRPNPNRVKINTTKLPTITKRNLGNNWENVVLLNTVSNLKNGNTMFEVTNSGIIGQQNPIKIYLTAKSFYGLIKSRQTPRNQNNKILSEMAMNTKSPKTQLPISQVKRVIFKENKH